MVCFLLLLLVLCHGIPVNSSKQQPKWLINMPPDWHNITASHSGLVLSANVETFVELATQKILQLNGATDGEIVDAVEHYFWGMSKGIAMELGALDGSPSTQSMTFEFESTLGWKRVLVEGNPQYKMDTIKRSPSSFAANAAICEHVQDVHFVHRNYVGGIVEFMEQSFLKSFHQDIFDAGTPPGNLETVNWSGISDVSAVKCIPLHHILHVAGVHHINFFILDVEGGELMVLKSINWKKTRFDVLCVETDPSRRPPGYADQVTAFLAERGYKNDSGQVGRNIWYIREDFKPSRRPGLAKDCFNGYKKTDFKRESFMRRRPPPYQACPLDSVS